MIPSVKTLGERIIYRKAIGSPVLSNVDLFFDPPTCSNIVFNFKSTLSERRSSASTTKAMTNSKMGFEDETQPVQKHSMHLNSNHTCQVPPEHTEIVEAQIYHPLLCDQLYKNHPWSNIPNMRMIVHPFTYHPSKRIGKCSMVSGPSIGSPYEYHGSATNQSPSSKSRSVTCICNTTTYTAASPELPPLLQLHEHQATVSLPDGISCVINPYPDRSDNSKTFEPSVPANISASSLPTCKQRYQGKSTHEVVMKSVEGQELRITDHSLIKNTSRYEEENRS